MYVCQLVVLVLFSIVTSTLCAAQLGVDLLSRPNGPRAYGSVPLMFEANQGQTDPQVQFLSRGNGYSVFLSAGGMVLAFHPSASAPFSSAPLDVTSNGRTRPGLSGMRQLQKLSRTPPTAAVTINLVGSASSPTVIGEEPLNTKVNYFIGRDPAQWRRNVQTYGRIRYRNVYPGIDLVYYGNQHQLEYDFDLSPGADPTRIQFSINGADAVSVDPSGSLILTEGASQLLFQPPVIYQQLDGMRTPVAGTYVQLDATHVGFTVAPHDETKPMVIDPVLVYSTFLGGSSDDYGVGVAVDSTGEAYVLGLTDSPDFPKATLGSYSSTQYRMFVAKFDSSGSALVFADYLGSTNGGDSPSSIALDSSGNVYLSGSTISSDFPVASAYQATFTGSEDAFLTKLSSNGASVVYSTFLGGSNSQIGYSVSVDPANEAVVVGTTFSTDFPLVSPYQSSVAPDAFGNWGEYGFVTKFAASGSSLVYSTYLGGNTLNTPSCAGCTFPDSEPLDVVTDSSGNAYVTGYTSTTNFPVTSGAFATSYPGYYQSDVGFVSKFTSAGGMAYSTYLGGSTSSYLDAIAVDSAGSAYVTGYDIANDGFPIVTTSICDPSTVACNGAVIAKLDPTGASLVYSIFLGTSNNMAGAAIQVDGSGNAYIVGSDVGFDLANPIETYAGGNGNVVLAEINPSATTVLMATFLGGSTLDFPDGSSSLALDGSGFVYITGVTESSDFPVTQSGLQTSFGGSSDAFLAKIDPVTSAPAVSMSPFSLQFGSQIVATTSAPQTVVLRNMGSASLNISTETMTDADFAETDNCSGSVSPASSCTLTITFTPTTTGSLSGSFVLTDNAADSPQSLSLSGTGTGAQFVIVSPQNLRFAASSVGSASPSKPITFVNNGSSAVVVQGIRVSPNFAATGNDCGTVVPGASCTVQVSFVPGVPGPLTGTLQFLDSASGNSQVVALSGSGTDFVVSPNSSSATIQPGETASYQLNVSPSGGAFSGTITFSCSVAPVSAACTANPSAIVPGTKSVAVRVAIETTAPVASGASANRGRFLALGLPMDFALFGVLLLGAGNRRRGRRLFALAPITFVLLLLAGCGGGSTTQPPASNQLQPGTYSVSVTAVSGTARHVTDLTLIVQ